MKMKQWVKMPPDWTTDGSLRSFKWSGGDGSASTAALMAYAALLHRMDDASGEVKATYDQLCATCSISRAKLSAGLRALEDRELIETIPKRNSRYSVLNYDANSGWAKFPAQGLYSGQSITAFNNFHLRSIAELDALKLYFLFAARRDRETNMAHITYDDIEKYSGIGRARIKAGLSLLAVNALVHTEHVPSKFSEHGIANAYRLAHLHSNRHLGTQGRSVLQDVF